MMIKVGEQCWINSEDIQKVAVYPEYAGWKIGIKIRGMDDTEDVGLYDSEQEASEDAQEILNKISERTA